MSITHENPAQAIYDELVEIRRTLKEILMATGLAALQQAVADLTAAVAAAATALQANGDSDAAVATLAADVTAQTEALKAATPAPPAA